MTTSSPITTSRATTPTARCPSCRPAQASANQAWFEYIPAVLDELVDQPAHDFRPVAGDTPAMTRRGTACAFTAPCAGAATSTWCSPTRAATAVRPATRTPWLGTGPALNSVRLVEIADAGAAYADGNPPAFLPYGDGTIANPARTREPGTLLGPPSATGCSRHPWRLRRAGKSGATPCPAAAAAGPVGAAPGRLRGQHFTIDAWSGYPHELAYLMRELAQRQVCGCVSLSGDHHMHGAGTIRRSTTALDAAPVMVDFNVAGISSSPLFDELSVVAAGTTRHSSPLSWPRRTAGLCPSGI